METDAKKPCSVEGCERKVVARGWCGPHYRRWHDHGDPLAGGPIKPRHKGRSVCRVEGCNRGTDGLGLCRKHYARFKRTGTTEPNPEKHTIEKQKCRYGDCDRVESARGFCAGHYVMVRTSPRHEHLLPPEARAERCLAPECGSPQYANGLCRSHDSAWKYGGGELWVKGQDEAVEPGTPGGKIKLERIRQGLTLEGLAERVGVTRERVRQVEANRPSSTLVLNAYAVALDMDVAALIDPASLEAKELPHPHRREGTLRERVARLEKMLGGPGDAA